MNRAAPDDSRRRSPTILRAADLLRRIPPRPACWGAIVGLGAFQAFAHRNEMNVDGLSYVDIARAFATGDLNTAINPHWGPLYPLLIAAGIRVEDAPRWEFNVVHAVNLAILIVALFAFDFLLRELLRLRASEPGDVDAPVVADTSASLFAYAIFLYCALARNGVALVTPDLCVAAAVFSAGGLILRLGRIGPSWKDSLLLGGVLGLGYLAKSVMFPVGACFLVAAAVARRRRRERGVRVEIVSAVTFLAVASVLIVPISRAVGRPTFGTAGTLAYAWEVNGAPHTNFQGDSNGVTGLLHPPKRLLHNPELYDFSGHLVGTYPPWFDPAYWNAGARIEFRPWLQIRQLHRSAAFYIDLFLGSAGGVATLLVAMVWLRAERRVVDRDRGLYLALLLPALGALALYALVHVESRYIAPFAAILWLVPVLAARAKNPRLQGGWTDRAATIAACFLATPVAFRTVSVAWPARDRPFVQWTVASDLRRMGLGQGDRIAVTGLAIEGQPDAAFETYWAHLVGAQISAEIPRGEAFLCADSAQTAPVYALLQKLGVRALVTRGLPSRFCERGWQGMDGTGYYARMVPQ